MANHPNRNWRRKWHADLTTGMVAHESGLAVRYQDGTGEIVAGLPILSTDADQALDQARRLARLLKEAGDIYQQHKDQEHGEG